MAAKASRGKLHRSTSTWTTSTFSVEENPRRSREARAGSASSAMTRAPVPATARVSTPVPAPISTTRWPRPTPASRTNSEASRLLRRKCWPGAPLAGRRRAATEEFYAPCEPRAVTPRAILRLKCAWQESNPPANQAFSTLEDSTEDSTICSRAVAFEQLSVLELGLVGKNVRVRVRGHGEVALSDELTYAGPADAAQVLKRDAPMAQVMR